MKYESNRKNVDKTLHRAELKALRLVGIMLKGQMTTLAQKLKIHDTGLFKQSVAYEIIDAKEPFLRIGNSVKYAIYVELGTWKMKARPVTKPAVDRNKTDIRKLIEDVIRGEMK